MFSRKKERTRGTTLEHLNQINPKERLAGSLARCLRQALRENIIRQIIYFLNLKNDKELHRFLFLDDYFY